MEYERLILDLLQKVSMLEDRVTVLENSLNTKENENSSSISKPERGSYTNMVKNYLKEKIYNARDSGLESITLVSGDVQKAVGLKNRLPLICNAMRSVMSELTEIESKIIYEPPSGLSSTLEVRWTFK